MLSIERVRYVKEKYTDFLLGKENVIGVGLGKKKKTADAIPELCIAVYVTKKKPVSHLKEIDIVPKELDGVMTKVVETGNIKAH